MEAEVPQVEEHYEARWDNYDRMSPHYEKLFLECIAPLTPEEFVGKKICDAGCGMGRYSYWPLKYGAKSLLAFDNSFQAVASTKKTLQDFPNATVVEKSIYDLQYPEAFDICFSIGVIHHLRNPRKAIDQLIRAVKPGGKLILWVYDYEWNKAYAKFLKIFHPLLRVFPPPLSLVLTYLLSVPLYFFLKLLPSRSPFIQEMKSFPFSHLRYIVHDLFIPSIVQFYKREDLDKLLRDCDLRDIQIYRNRRNWTVIGTK